MKHINTIFIASGGTGGHIIPARCLAQQLSQDKHRVWLLGDRNYRGYINGDDGFTSVIISSSQIRKKPLELIKAAFKIGFGILQSLALTLIHQPRYVFAFGGYSTFPVLIAAVMLRKKIILHEQNAHLGKVNRIFAKHAHKIALSFKKTSGIDDAYKHKTLFTGNPVREEILALNKLPYTLPTAKHRPNSLHAAQPMAKPANKMGYDVLLASDFKDAKHHPFQAQEDEKEEDLFNILVIGGSGGAKIFSDILPKAFFNLSDDFKGKINIIQQCRAELSKATYKQYQSFNLNAEVRPFFSDMPDKLKKAHLVIARSGSSSVFEFCAAKKPMILIPFEKAADNHQEKNANFFSGKSAAIVIPEKEFTIHRIGEVLRNLMNSPVVLKKMSSLASDLAVLKATKNLANLVRND